MSAIRMLTLVAAIVLAPLDAFAQDWLIDTERSRIGFTATLEGAEFEGLFKAFNGTIRFDEKALQDSRFDVTVDVTSIDTGNDELNAGMALREWFDFRRYKSARFESSRVVAVSATGYRIDGKLQVKKTSKALQLPFRWTRDGERARIDGETVLNRIDFDLGAGDWSDPSIVGHDVRVWTELHLIRAD